MNQIDQTKNIINELFGKPINIIFYMSRGDRVSVSCRKNELISEIIKRFNIKVNLIYKNLMFIYNGKKLNENITVSEAALHNNSQIFVVEKKS